MSSSDFTGYDLLKLFLCDLPIYSNYSNMNQFEQDCTIFDWFDFKRSWFSDYLHIYHNYYGWNKWTAN